MSDAAERRIAVALKSRRLDVAAKVLLDAHRPLAPLLADASAALAPLLGAALGRSAGARARSLLGDGERDPLNRLRAALDEEHQPAEADAVTR